MARFVLSWMFMVFPALAAVSIALVLSADPRAEAYATYQARLSALVATPDAAAQGVASAAPPSAAVTGEAACLLAPGAGNAASVRDCAACHASHVSNHSHPVDVPQDGGTSRTLRRSEEVVKRGVLLPDGRVTCLSCHDGNSPWKHKIALPPSAPTRSRVKPGNPATYGEGRASPAALPAGSDVSPAPLCLACHAMD